jgi:hypothetical protein
MGGGGPITAAAGAAAAPGVVMVSGNGSTGCEATSSRGIRLPSLCWGAAYAGVEASGRHNPSCHERNASVTMNAPAASPHKSIRCLTNAPKKRSDGS